jgi:hypothetical protein
MKIIISFMEIFYYYFEGISEMNLHLSIVNSTILCTNVYKTGNHETEISFMPFDYAKLIGSLNQYILQMISILVICPHDIMKMHVSEITKFLKLMTSIPYKNFTSLLKYNFLETLLRGTKMWLAVMKHLLVYNEDEVEKLAKLINRYFIVTHLFLWEHEHLCEGMTLSPLCNI